MIAPIDEPSTREKKVVGALVKALFYRRRNGGPWSVPAHLDHERVEFDGNVGARLVGLHFPVKDAKGMVVLVHPDKRYGKHWFVREGWIEWLHENGYAAFAFDLCRYGESRGGSTYLHEDVLAAIDTVRRLAPGLPIHVVGLSIGAYAAINAAPRMTGVASLVLESPYPDFMSWYEGANAPRVLQALNRALGRMFPRTYRRIHAAENIRHVTPPRILVVGAPDDKVTPIALTRQIAEAAPRGRTTYVEVDAAAHLGLFHESPGYREAMLASFAVAAPAAAKPLEVILTA